MILIITNHHHYHTATIPNSRVAISVPMLVAMLVAVAAKVITGDGGDNEDREAKG